MRFVGFLISLLFSVGIYAQTDAELTTEIKTFQEKLDTQYKRKKSSPLSRKERKKFEGHSFFPIDLDYVVWANFERIEKEDTIIMNTVQDRVKFFRSYAKIHFEIKGESGTLTVYQSYRLREIEEYKDYLFIPFRDATSGEESYGGGRYLDILIPDENADSVRINFNKAYNPYCAYTAGYNCTIPPAENTLKLAIRAGLKVPSSANHH